MRCAQKKDVKVGNSVYCGNVSRFQVNGPVGLASWKDYCYDLSGSDVYSQVKSDDFVLKEGDAVQGIAYAIETYGLIYNKTILEDYFGKDYAVVKSADEINSFDKLKAVADSIQENKADLGSLHYRFYLRAFYDLF